MSLFAGGPVGSGRQWVPWIHIDDIARAHERAATDASMEGAYNATSPNPVTMTEFTRTLGRVMGRPSWARVPEPALRMVVGQGAPAYVASQRAEPARLLDAGFAFDFAELEPALRDLLGRPAPALDRAQV
jgi:NAD dependent epimerase/dehydratase family enzyme